MTRIGLFSSDTPENASVVDSSVVIPDGGDRYSFDTCEEFKMNLKTAYQTILVKQLWLKPCEFCEVVNFVGVKNHLQLEYLFVVTIIRITYM